MHFTGEQENGEQIYFSVSSDGLHWEDIGGGKPALVSHIGEQGVRDPFLVKDEKKGVYYLIATDLRMGSGKSWDDAQYRGSRDIIVWESENLLDWSRERSCTVGVEGAGCVWAPESVYLPEREEFFVFWASMVKQGTDKKPKQRIYGNYTKDFREFTTPFVYLEADNHVIDMNIVFDNGWYYRFVKDETLKIVTLDRVRNLEDTFSEQIRVPALEGLFGVEGPEAYQLKDGRWCLIVDQFGSGKGYLPLTAKDLAGGGFEVAGKGGYDMGTTRKRHGGVLRITQEQMDELCKRFSAG